jgi:hypothetical protein
MAKRIHSHSPAYRSGTTVLRMAEQGKARLSRRAMNIEHRPNEHGLRKNLKRIVVRLDKVDKAICACWDLQEMKRLRVHKQELEARFNQTLNILLEQQRKLIGEG